MTENGDVVDGYAAACEEREQLYPTGLQLETTGVALPHADSHYVKRSAIAVATLLEPVTFRKMGDPAQDVSVRAVFMLAPQKGEEQLLFLEGLVRFFPTGRSVAKTVLPFIRSPGCPIFAEIRFWKDIIVQKFW